MSPTNSSHFWLIPIFLIVALTLTFKSTLAEQTKDHHLNRKSIVFDIKTPKVFYCPQEKPADANKVIVKAKPLDKLCEFGGKSKPKNEPGDCYNDLDETEFACEEKKRFMVSRFTCDGLITVNLSHQLTN